MQNLTALLAELYANQDYQSVIEQSLNALIELGVLEPDDSAAVAHAKGVLTATAQFGITIGINMEKQEVL
jgi:hypothetical protein